MSLCNGGGGCSWGRIDAVNRECGGQWVAMRVGGLEINEIKGKSKRNRRKKEEFARKEIVKVVWEYTFKSPYFIFKLNLNGRKSISFDSFSKNNFQG